MAKPAPGGRYIYVAKTGTDKAFNTDRRSCINIGWEATRPERCQAPDASHPLATISYGVQVAKPGDVIVVRAGTYKEAVGYGARPGTASKPIVLQAAPKETVTLAGQFYLKSGDYWTITGIHFKYDAVHTKGEQVVAMFGGRGWKFTRNEIAGGRGYANLMIREDATQVVKGTTAERTKAAPQSYTVANNCIRENLGKGIHGQYHDIYLQPTLYSKGGIVERNLLAGAPEGANIKVSGSNVTGSANDVIIRYNTMAYAGTGIVSGLASQNINSYGNAILAQRNGTKYDAAMKTYDAAKTKNIVFTSNLVSGYAITKIQSPGDKLMVTESTAVKKAALTGSYSGCTVRLVDPALASKYGVQAVG
ncbi:hypothetical protein ASF30_11515 [Leifsonia sp. Leaf264]|nr:hypothetical protein ASF30_11515 [Leifsonia sp. Leaf264]